MLTGKRAFQKPTSPETMSAILNEDPPEISRVAPNLPLSLQRVVHRCLEKNPEQRFQSASDLAFALEAMSDSANPSHAADLPERKKSARRRTAIATALVAAALGVAVLAYFGMRGEAVPKISQYIQLTLTASGNMCRN